MNIEQEDILSDRLIDALNTSISSAAAGPAVLGQHGSQSSLTALGPTPPPLASPYHQQHGHGQGHPRHDAGSPLSSLSSRGAAARAANGASPYSTSNSSFTSSPASTSPTLTPDMTSLQQQQQQQQQQQHGYSEPFAPLSPAGRTHAAAMSMSLGLAPPSSSTALVSTALNLTSVDEYGRAVAEAARLVDRRNLLAAFKASVQSVLSHAAHNGSSLDDTSIGVQQFCLILEKILYHGLKPPKKGWISSRHCEFWDVLELAAADNRRKSALVVSRLRPVVTAIESYCKSPRGKSRVFIRMALMEKRLAEYLQFVLQNPERLGEYYEREALLRGEEESLLIIGSLVGLNVIDFIFCIKGTQMDDPTEQPIDFGTLLLMTASTRTDSALEDAKQSEQRFPVSYALILVAAVCWAVFGNERTQHCSLAHLLSHPLQQIGVEKSTGFSSDIGSQSSATSVLFHCGLFFRDRAVYSYIASCSRSQSRRATCANRCAAETNAGLARAKVVY
ncbi:hypothetical protein, variant [Capsaspora owczarzaki ATCC 30864]|uniref:RUN domain-containing protein n=1 Tax=Capsaspora owczarzaki (strain ATCC 30864) TaxID=595528 RepID=A0A0D2WJ95_CAPO3|nr:hypothetical protein, variant [Capsaspora owczarzaki ATCC 30864]